MNAPLARVALQAAHLAELMNSQLVVRAGLPVRAPQSTIVEGTVIYLDGAKNGWRITAKGYGEDVIAEDNLASQRIDARCEMRGRVFD